MGHLINKHVMIGLALMSTLFLAASAALAGGWNVVTLDQLPGEIIAGQPLTISFMIRQHGRTPGVYDQVIIKATHLQSHEKISIEAQAKKAVGHYEATLKFPQAGIWRWGIGTGLMPVQQPMPDLMVFDSIAAKNAKTQLSISDEKAAIDVPTSVSLSMGIIGAAGAIGALLFWLRTRTSLALALLTITAVTGVVGFGLAANPAALPMMKVESEQMVPLPDQVAATASAELGQALFVAKGCIVCHQHDAVNDIRRSYGLEGFNIGPNLPTLVTDPKFLHTWLKSPSAIKPNTQMPNLNLKKAEIEALIAFLLSSKPNVKEAGIFPVP